MSGVKSSGPASNVVAGQLLHDDHGDPIGTREYVVDNGLPSSAGDPLEHAFASLTAEELSVLLTNRVYIERAKGMLMALYDIDADQAFELLVWRSQVANVKVRDLSRQLVEEFPTLAETERVQPGYDAILMTAHHRIPTEPAT